MPARRVRAHEGIADTRGKVALQRGPLVFAFEAADNGADVLALELAGNAAIAASFRKDLLGGVTVLSAPVATPAGRTATAVPYFAWANRGRGAMAVWLRSAKQALGDLDVHADVRPIDELGDRHVPGDARELIRLMPRQRLRR
jgi:DUF1680 family protein